MRKNLIFLFTMLFSFFLCSSALYAQEDSTEVEEDGWEWDNWDDDWEFDVDFFDSDWDSHPTISLGYGISKLSRDDFAASFAEPKIMELKLGYSSEDDCWQAEYILEHSYKFLYVSNISTDLANAETSTSELGTNLWRFGFGKESGYAYKLGSAAIIPYTSSSIGWSRVEFKDVPAAANDRRITDLYNESFRFGTSGEAGVRFKIIPPLGIDFSYERAAIFERHLFWKWLGSAVIEKVGLVLLDEFIEEVLDASPGAGPIVNMVLKGGLLYAMYELRQEKMNWPFDSAPPLSYDQFKFGLTFAF